MLGEANPCCSTTLTRTSGCTTSRRPAGETAVQEAHTRPRPVDRTRKKTYEAFFDGVPRDVRDIATPREMVRMLQEKVIGQDHAKKIMSVAVYNHYKRIGAVRSGAEGRRRKEKTLVEKKKKKKVRRRACTIPLRRR